MKRDMELIRKLLLALESDNPNDPPEYDEQTIEYHKALLVESGLAHGSVEEVMTGEIIAFVTRLTWEGHEFLDAARNESGWKHVMKEIASTVGTTSISVVQALLIEYAKGKLNV